MVTLRFAELSVLSVYSTLIRSGGVILLALWGVGPMSFVLPVIAVGLFKSANLARKRPGSWRPSFPRRRLFGALAIPLFWIMASTLAMSLMTNGDSSRHRRAAGQGDDRCLLLRLPADGRRVQHVHAEPAVGLHPVLYRARRRSAAAGACVPARARGRVADAVLHHFRRRRRRAACDRMGGSGRGNGTLRYRSSRSSPSPPLRAWCRRSPSPCSKPGVRGAPSP